MIVALIGSILIPLISELIPSIIFMVMNLPAKIRYNLIVLDSQYYNSVTNSKLIYATGITIAILLSISIGISGVLMLKKAKYPVVLYFSQFLSLFLLKPVCIFMLYIASYILNGRLFYNIGYEFLLSKLIGINPLILIIVIAFFSGSIWLYSLYRYKEYQLYQTVMIAISSLILFTVGYEYLPLLLY